MDIFSGEWVSIDNEGFVSLHVWAEFACPDDPGNLLDIRETLRIGHASRLIAPRNLSLLPCAEEELESALDAWDRRDADPGDGPADLLSDYHRSVSPCYA